MKITIIGGTGFIGTHLIKELLNHNIELIITGTSELNARNKSWYKNVDFLELDLNKQIKPINYKKLASSDLLINLAWEGLPNYNKLFHYEKVLMKQYEFIKNLVELGLKDIVITGTCFEYGKREGPLDTTMETNPTNPYAIAKDTLRKFLFLLMNDHPFNLKWLRLFYMYGEGQSKYSILSQLQTAINNGDKYFNMSGGEQERDYLPVTMVAKEIIDISLSNKESNIYNICSGSPIKLKTLVEDYIKANNASININYGFYPYNESEAMSFWGVK